MLKTIALNEHGRRIGESHPRAKLLDYEVEQVLALLDAGLSYAEVANEVRREQVLHRAHRGRAAPVPACRAVAARVRGRVSW